MDGPGLEQRADLAEGERQVVEASAVDGGRARIRRIEAHDDAHRGGLARAVRPEEPGHLPGLDVE